ncbi:hypothetical protein MKZ38_010303 [Zalerion maritima]|uniref:Uncharacterized protein n=1 Tax=Zalerion maritima TaxID=339359 RepID=A0AAD5RSG5_9PEZI|nr:hypothetical protein MKZ38_010303 [Zalerion maritima]
MPPTTTATAATTTTTTTTTTTRKKIDLGTRAQAVSLMAWGVAPVEIRDRLKISTSMIYSYYDRAVARGFDPRAEVPVLLLEHVQDSGRTGRPRKGSGSASAAGRGGEASGREKGTTEVGSAVAVAVAVAGTSTGTRTATATVTGTRNEEGRKRRVSMYAIEDAARGQEG